MATQGSYKRIDDGLVLHFDTANIKCFRGEPTVNIYHPTPMLTSMRHGLTYTYLGLENGWEKYSISGTVPTGDNYPYTFYVQGSYNLVSGAKQSMQFKLRCNCIEKFDPNSGGYGPRFEGVVTNIVWTSVSYSYIPNNNFLPNVEYLYKIENMSHNTGINQTQPFYLRSRGKDGVTFNSLTDFIWLKNQQIEDKDHTTQYTPTSRGVTVATGGGLIDLSNNQNHGELVNSVLYDSDNCGSLKFDGVDDYINLGNTTYTQFSHITPWTINMWFNIVSYTNTYPGILRRGSSVGSGILLWFNNNNVLWYKHNGSESGITIPNLIGQWINLMLVYNGIGNVKAFINGVYNKDLLPMSGTEISDSLVLGTGDEPGNVKISTFHKYNRPLSQSEITQIYNSTKTRYL